MASSEEAMLRHALQERLISDDEDDRRPAATAAEGEVVGSLAATLPVQPPLADGQAAADPAAPTGQQLQDEKKARRRELKGLGFNALSTVFGTGMSLFAKISGGQGIGVFEIVLTRSLILVLFTGPELIYHRTNPFADKRRRWLLVLRGLLGFCSISSLYLAVALLPLADASVLSFLSPIFVAALSPVILKERTSLATLLGIPVAMVGVILVAQPVFLFGGGGGISRLGVIVGIAQACFNALARMCVRALSLGSDEPMASIIFGQGAISCVGAAILCGATKNFKVPTEVSVWGPLLAGGLLGYFYQLALTAGLQRARAAPAVAMSYLSVIWGIVADILVFHDLPDDLSLMGAGIICLSSFTVAFNQKRRAAHTIADTNWQKSSVRLQEQEAEQALLADQENGARASSAEWLSAEEGSLAVTSRAASLGGPAWDGEEGAAFKDQASLAAVQGADEDIKQPGTPAAAQVLLPVGQHASTESLALLGSSPDAPSSAGLPTPRGNLSK